MWREIDGGWCGVKDRVDGVLCGWIEKGDDDRKREGHCGCRTK